MSSPRSPQSSENSTGKTLSALTQNRKKKSKDSSDKLDPIEKRRERARNYSQRYRTKLKTEVENLRAENTDLKSQNDELLNKINKLEILFSVESEIISAQAVTIADLKSQIAQQPPRVFDFSGVLFAPPAPEVSPSSSASITSPASTFVGDPDFSSAAALYAL